MVSVFGGAFIGCKVEGVAQTWKGKTCKFKAEVSFMTKMVNLTEAEIEGEKVTIYAILEPEICETARRLAKPIFDNYKNLIANEAAKK